VLAGVTGCNEGEKLISRDEAHQIADDVAARHSAELESRVAELEERLKEAEAGVAGVRALGLENATNAEALQNQVNSNASVANDNALSEMTRRGRCGYTEERDAAGYIIQRPVKCTREDLRD
jgi:hypothetical protein